MQKQQLDNEKSQLQLQISKSTKENNEINEEKIQLQSQMNKLKEDKNHLQMPIKQSNIDENRILTQQLEEYKIINSENSQKKMHKYFELI